MLELTTYTELEIAHRLLTAYTSRCKHLHGHRYEVEITVGSLSGNLNDDGMIVDFKKLKEVVKTVLDDKWDHGTCLNSKDPLVPAILDDAETERVHVIDFNPTLEWMVAHWGNTLQAAFDSMDLGIRVLRLKASETAKNTVTWIPDQWPAQSSDENRKALASRNRDLRAKLEQTEQAEARHPSSTVIASSV